MVAVAAYATWHAHVGVLIGDEWEYLSAADLWRQLPWPHNEHRFSIPILVLIADKVIVSGSGAVNVTVAFILVLVNAALFIAVMTRSERGWALLWISALVAAVQFCNAQHDNFFWGFNIANVMPLTFAASAFYVLAFGQNRTLALAAAALFGFMASISQAGGVQVPFIVTVMAALQGRPARHVAALGAVALATLAVFMIGNPTLASHAEYVGRLSNVFGRLHYVAVFLGTAPSIQFRHPIDFALAAYIGGCGMALAAWYGLHILVRPARFTAVDLFLAAIIAYVLGLGLLISSRLHHFTIESAVAARYAAPALMFWTALFLLAWNSRTITLRWLGNSVPALALITVAGLAFNQSMILQFADMFRWRMLQAKTALLARVVDPDAFREIIPEHKRASVPAVLARTGMAPFSEPWTQWHGSKLSEHVAIATGRCLGYVDGVVPLSGSTGTRLAGWAWDQAGKPLSRLVIANHDGVVVGYALTRVPRSDVKALIPGVTALKTGWMGHASASERLQTYGLIDDRTVCPIGDPRSVAR